ncbi:Beta-galactosidase [Clavibacter michiganensis subsp. michiganensis]|uniref:beta-galactosidase n=1 Tax=Clavibacter michiganensis subsp. michiganensis TaxID=33013 RepID=A0A251XN92_CLAMM|nr:Beta-galactosidase [Clavibacter michiganensis subsp. michiganensis]OUE04927.1 Beta-galactosidase [Clavibacter michiganensis subsp. michiganensis]
MLHGHGSPAYTNLQYPFPIDPPHVPDANPTGEHRRTFELPASFADAERVLLRTDGIEGSRRSGSTASRRAGRPAAASRPSST